MSGIDLNTVHFENILNFLEEIKIFELYNIGETQYRYLLTSEGYFNYFLIYLFIYTHYTHTKSCLKKAYKTIAEKCLLTVCKTMV